MAENAADRPASLGKRRSTDSAAGKPLPYLACQLQDTCLHAHAGMKQAELGLTWRLPVLVAFANDMYVQGAQSSLMQYRHHCY